MPRFAKRQGGPPVVDGISGNGVTLSGVPIPPPTGLATDGAAPTDASAFHPPVFIPSTSTQSLPAAATETPKTNIEASSATSKSISVGTLIGTCVGAFIGVGAFIFLALFFYRRYSANLKRRANTRAPLMRTREGGSETQRRGSRQDPWNKLDDADDRWDDHSPREGGDHVQPMEKLTMFKKSTPSVRTAYTTAHLDDTQLDFAPSFAQFDPKLAEGLSSVHSTSGTETPEPRPFLARVDVNPVISWDAEATGKETYLTARSRMSGGAVSPHLNMAIPTPAAIPSQEHLYYSEGQSAEIHNPADDLARRNNPFFNAIEDEDVPVRSAKAKGKEKMRYSDSESRPLPSQPMSVTVQHAPEEDKDRSMQSLMAALELPPDGQNPRVASMQPSLLSRNSQFTEDMTNDFPLPPGSQGYARR